MSNSYAINKLLADPSATVAGQSVEFQTPERIANNNNYSFATGATHNVLSQSYTDKTFIQSSSSFVEMSQWRIPLVSLEHNELETVVFYDIVGSSSNCNLKFTLEVGGVSAVLTLNLPSTAEIASGSFSISFPSSDQYYGTLTLEAQADTSNNAEIVLKSIMARWKPIASPISAGLKKQYNQTDAFVPFGVSRVSANQSFTSRFAHNVLDNISLMRQRLQSYLTWSGCYSANSSLLPNPEDAGAPELYLGVGHIRTLVGYPFIPSGYDSLSERKLELHIRYIGASSSIQLEFFGNIITLPANAGIASWHVQTIEIDYEQVAERGDILLPYYSASIDNTDLNLLEGLLVAYYNVPSAKFPTIDSSNHGKIIGLTLIGI